MNISRLNFLKSSIGIASTALIPVSITKKKRTSSKSNSDLVPGKRDITIPTIDISNETDRHTIIAQGTSDIRQGHPATLLMPDRNTIYATWNVGHGGPLGQLKKSVDGGRTWSDLLKVPDNWSQYENCPPLYLLTDPDGKERLFIFANRKILGDGKKTYQMYQAFSEDGGKTWNDMFATPVADSDGVLSEDSMPPTVMPFTAIKSVEGGKALIGVSNLRRVGEYGRSNVLSQSRSEDGGLSWSHWRVILDLGPEFYPCEPELIRSPAGKQLLMIIRENNRAFNSWIMVSNNEGKTWSEPYQATASVSMDRHQAEYAPDGRLLIVGRDTAEESPTKRHFVGWVGRYEDLLEGSEGLCRVKLLHTYKTTEYPGLEILPDETFVATNSVAYREGENYSVVCTRFRLEEVDRLLKS